MALTKISSTVIQSGAITAEKVATGVVAPAISNVQIANSSWSALDDTAISLDGGYILINGSHFRSGCSVLINNTPATSVTFVNSSQLRVQVPSANAGTYVAYVVNPGGGTAISVNALTYSATPTWVTGSTLSNEYVDQEISVQLEATGATSYALAAGSSLPANTTLASNGLFSGTVTGLESDTGYSFTINAIDDENQDSPRTFSLNILLDPVADAASGNGQGWATSSSIATNGTELTSNAMVQYQLNTTNQGGCDGDWLNYNHVISTSNFAFHTGHQVSWWPAYAVVRVTADGGTPRVLNQLRWKKHPNAVGNIDIYGSNQDITSGNYTNTDLYTRIGRVHMGGSNSGGSDGDVVTRSFNPDSYGYRWYLIVMRDNNSSALTYPNVGTLAGWAMYGLTFDKV